MGCTYTTKELKDITGPIAFCVSNEFVVPVKHDPCFKMSKYLRDNYARKDMFLGQRVGQVLTYKNKYALVTKVKDRSHPAQYNATACLEALNEICLNEDIKKITLCTDALVDIYGSEEEVIRRVRCAFSDKVTVCFIKE